MLDTQPIPSSTIEEPNPKALNSQIEALVARMRQVRILSTLPYPKVPFWFDNVDSVFPQPSRFRSFTRRLGIDDPWHILRLLRRAPHYDLVLIGGGERADLIYLMVAGLAFWIRTPHVIVEAHWQRGTGLKHLFQKLVFGLGRRVCKQIQPFTAQEIDIYHQAFHFPHASIVPIPYSPGLIGYDLDCSHGNFVLSGGSSYRDYETFLSAVETLPYPVEIGLPAYFDCPSTRIHRGKHIQVHRTLTDRQYLEKMAACRVLALPITPGLQRSTGDRTILNAMHMGKIVIATDSISSRIYIRHGENGFLVPEGDVAAWQATLQKVFSMSEAEYAQIAERAEWTAKQEFSEELRLFRIMHHALQVVPA